MANFISKLFKGSSKGCCNVKIEEVKSEETDKGTGGKDDNIPKKPDSCCK